MDVSSPPPFIILMAGVTFYSVSDCLGRERTSRMPQKAVGMGEKQFRQSGSFAVSRIPCHNISIIPSKAQCPMSVFIEITVCFSTDFTGS